MHILDGGMGQALLAMTQRPVTNLWSADVMLHEPEHVAALHLAFLEAGAQTITLNTYTATPERLANNQALQHFDRLHHLASQAATEAIKRYSERHPHAKQPSIAGCLPPLVASYHPDVAPDYDACLASYQQLVAQQNAVADVFICETMASINEAKAACMAAKTTGKPVWVAFTVCDNEPHLLRSKESLETAIEEIALLQPDAILLNCSRPEAISKALPICMQSNLTVGAYANGFTSIASLYPGTTVTSLQTRQDLTPDAYADIAQSWADMGATIIGGCCEVGPEHIKALHLRFNTAAPK
ncbi:MAG: homocysteine S-methyltransferase family protein [Glaciecola sp.]|jgi:S-methylmethionine-dependent homocysteine/selenocysteine methylase